MYEIICASADYGDVIVVLDEYPNGQHYSFNKTLQLCAISPKITMSYIRKIVAGGNGIGELPEKSFASLEEVRKWIQSAQRVVHSQMTMKRLLQYGEINGGN